MIEQDRLEAVERLGKPGIMRFRRFEFLPERVQPLALVVRQPAEDDDGGFFLALGLERDIDRVEQGCVAALDFDQVVDQQHLDHAADLDGACGIFGQDDAEQGQVPGVLGGVFAA